ncbi:hypothetical protein ACFX5K_05185 [Rickettsiales bacterium LUAb2]
MKLKSPKILKKLSSLKKAVKDRPKKQREKLTDNTSKIEDNNAINQNTDQFIARINKILEALGQLFQPFKDLLLNIFPSSKRTIKFIDLIGLGITKLVISIAKLIPLTIKFVKGKLFKIIIIALIIIILVNATISRIISNKNYKAIIAKAIENTVGYKTVIEGNINVNLLTMSVTINNAGFYQPTVLGQGLILSQLSVNQITINFAYLPLLLGELKVSNLRINRANVIYRSANASDSNDLIDKYNNLKVKLSNLANLTMVLPKMKVNELDRGDTSENIQFLDKLNNLDQNSTGLSTSGSNNFSDLSGRLLNDNDEKYLNLNGVFAPKVEDSSKFTMININNNSITYGIIDSIIKRIKLNYSDITYLQYSNLNLQVNDANNKEFLYLANLSGSVTSNFMGSKEFIGSGELFNNSIYFDLLEKPANKESNFTLNLSYNDQTLQSKDIIIKGKVSQNGSISGDIVANGSAFNNILSPSVLSIPDIDVNNSKFQSTFSYDKSVFKMPDMQIMINKQIHTGSIVYNFAQNSVLDVKLNLQLQSVNSLIAAFNSYKEASYSNSNNFNTFADMIIGWRNGKAKLLTAKIINLDLVVANSTLNNNPLNSFKASMFLDEDNNFYLTDLALDNSDLNIDLSGELNLAGKSGVLIAKTSGSISNLCSYMACSNNLYKIINAVANNKDNLNLEAKVFLGDNRIVFNDILGNIGDKLINNTNATLISRNGGSDLSISSQFDALKFQDLQNVYNFNKQSSGLYYNSNSNFIGLPENLTLHLSLYSNKFYYKNLLFNNFQADASIISSGILVHDFQMATPDNTGSIKGSFNFDNKVTPSIVGNVNLNNVLIEAENLHEFLFTNYNLAGKIVVNGNINIAGDDYYSGINSVSGNLALVKYERLKLNENNNSQGFYMTLIKATDSGKVVYKIGDLYSNLTINNNMLSFSPVIIRLINGNTNYRGTFTGSLDLINNSLNTSGNMVFESNGKQAFNFTASGNLANALVNFK